MGDLTAAPSYLKGSRSKTLLSSANNGQQLSLKWSWDLGRSRWAAGGTFLPWRAVQPWDRSHRGVESPAVVSRPWQDKARAALVCWCRLCCSEQEVGQRS